MSVAYCGDCPDHEACHQGAPCELVKRVSALDLLGVAPDWTGPLTTEEYIDEQRAPRG